MRFLVEVRSLCPVDFEASRLFPLPFVGIGRIVPQRVRIRTAVGRAEAVRAVPADCRGRGRKPDQRTRLSECGG